MQSFMIMMVESSDKIQSTSTSKTTTTIRAYRCYRQQNQIICPTDNSQLTNVYKASESNSSIKLGPNLYHRQFTISSLPAVDQQQPSKTKSRTHVIYYTKQYSDNNGGGGGEQNTFDLNDEDEHQFMHQTNIDEHIIDDGGGHQQLKLNKIKINTFIDDNKAMIRRMFGDYHHHSKQQQNDGHLTPLLPDVGDDDVDGEFRDHFSSFHDHHSGHHRSRRSIKPKLLSGNKVDSCESTVEIVTPYWASNSAGKIRAIVNTQHLQQAIQQEVCQAVQTRRCNKDCRCEQKYKWHRLLAYDPDDDCKGIFMDWFLFPSCCVCRCAKY
ncbi:protein spaetzle 3 isoform X2 [Dermatophagoides farinae]